MTLKPMWLRHICSILFTFYYLVFADAAEERVRRVRATISIEHMRVSWEKVPQNPILRTMSKLIRPKVTVREIMSIDRPAHNSQLPPTEIYFFYAGAPETLSQHDTILLQFPGGGFVSMPPPCHEDAIAVWANQTGLPIVSVNYKKAPEHPYPWPIEECFDIYLRLVETRGTIIGLSGTKKLNIIVLGDSAGGNISSATTLKIIAHNQQLKRQQNNGVPLKTFGADEGATDYTESLLPMPAGLILIYPALDFEMSCWMSPSQVSLIHADSTTQLFRTGSLETLWQSKDHFSHVSPLSVVPDVEKNQSLWRRLLGRKKTRTTIRQHVNPILTDKKAWQSSNLAMTSRMSFFNDRIISPDVMRAMAIMYLGPYATPDFETDYLLSPIIAPLELLAEFPKTYMICGEKDPLVDDTVILAGRIRQAKGEFLGPEKADNAVHVKFLEGISHAFLQMMAFLPEAHQASRTIGDWIQEIASEVAHADPNVDFNIATRSMSSRVEVGAHHVAEIVTNEKDMLTRRKKQLVDGLF
ncbi:Alpha/Beta hydrolase protein [Phycomyces blakesleeanus]|uniref:Alpha/Beta hydrolase protein n=1 Tax=Phycomyces blakesleeanus TaxID=4837 RepID=A0ABR3B900_PHYBL